MKNNIDTVLSKIEQIDREHGSQSESNDSNKWVVAIIAEQCRLNVGIALSFANFEGRLNGTIDRLNASSRRLETLTWLLIGFGIIQVMTVLPSIIQTHYTLVLLEAVSLAFLCGLMLFVVLTTRKW